MSDKVPNVVTVTTAANETGFSPQHIRRLIDDACTKCDGAGCEQCFNTGRRLPAVKDAGVWLIFKDGLYLATHEERKPYELPENLKVTEAGIRDVNIDEPPPDADQVNLAREWLRQFCRYRQTLNYKPTAASYTLKDAVRRWAGTYIGNGAFITAAMQEGYVTEPVTAGSHIAVFNISLPRTNSQRYREACLN